MAKLMPNSTPQNWVMRFQISRPVMTYTVSMITSIHTRPSVSGTNRKWYSAVTANCRRERSTVSGSIMAGCRRGGHIELMHDARGRRSRTRPRLDEHQPEHEQERKLDDDDEAQLPSVAPAVARAEPGFSRRRRQRRRAGTGGGVWGRRGGLGHGARGRLRGKCASGHCDATILPLGGYAQSCGLRGAYPPRAHHRCGGWQWRRSE